MPATQDYTLIQFMRGGKYAVETVIPEPGEPVIDVDSGTLYYGDGESSCGIPINTSTAKILEPPVDLNDQSTWGRYYIEGKTLNLPDGVDLYGKFFLTVQGSTATQPNSVTQMIYVLIGDHSDKIYTRSSSDGCQTWTTWKEIGGKYVIYTSVDPDPNSIPSGLVDGGIVVVE